MGTVVARVSCCRPAMLILLSLMCVDGERLIAQVPRTLGVEYTVRVPDTGTQLFHVTAKFGAIEQPYLDLALPIWTPGWYTLEYYAANVRQFAVTDGRGRRLNAPLVGAQTWRVDTQGLTEVIVEFDYRATELSLNHAYVGPEYAFFTGVQLFLEPAGHRDAASTVRFELPAGWRVASALNETADPAVYRAADYDTLVDSPTWLGAFQQHRFEVAGKPYFVVFDAREDVSSERIAAHMTNYLAIVQAQARIFGGLPYEKYVDFYLPEGGDGALEHSNSSVVAGTPGFSGSPGVSSGHEHFHVWNVKRMRPAEMWPYDYSRPNETPSLWFSEGVTVYYSAMSAYRAGAVNEAGFLQWLTDRIRAREESNERSNMSPADASMSTWRAYLNEPVNYYVAGGVLGALLDLSILRDTDGRRGLDDVMRSLWQSYYLAGKGFAAADLADVVSVVAGRDYSGFFDRYVTGTEVPPYDTIFAAAGISAQIQPVPFGRLGAEVGAPIQGGRPITSVFPAGAARRAGLLVGDILMAVEGRPLPAGRLALPDWLAPSAGRRVVLSIVRDGQPLDVTAELGSGERNLFVLEFDPNPTPSQLIVRQAWLAKK